MRFPARTSRPGYKRKWKMSEKRGINEKVHFFARRDSWNHFITAR
ncbi:hypothetical protein CLOSTASPAR_02031 [[Clostridium] asparagiforme DSM 15981]|uniref:Uncharacterized protein n=1 Tax=[Clostridium] asparagiforme DSM 15981 TaxID=518636 RepID=C0CYF5_9FIRM|nr:hypothetical protein CLOSTASPAR_02031 [[Clostridium] asparagiforme DSM 15981]